MRSLTEQLTQYAKYHRDPRNIATHFVGIPMIVIAIAILLSRPTFELMGMSVGPVHALVLVTTLYYLRLNVGFGVLMGALLVGTLVLASMLTGASTGTWLTWGIGLFVVGWVFQFVGHFYEGKKPAFVDDIMGLVIGPLFVVAEALFMLGLCKDLKEEIERGAGPVAIQTPQQVKHS